MWYCFELIKSSKIMNASCFIFTLEKFMASMPSAEEYWLDTEFKSSDDPNDTITSFLFGPRFMSKLYKLSPPEDYELAMTLKRPSSMFLEDLSRPESKLSEERYGSVRRVYVMCDEDEAIPPAFQSWMIKNDEVKEVRMLKHSDHMPMFCMPKQLCYCLLEIALKHFAANSDDSPTSDPN
ncbi:salicylic acid-binding protein 2-like [Chenopodium quinoa]|uniref:salicylic acid-binding protein 2-like n=1 Tax=Chenopodium quinoa TaxID=63459 RepID=UPI000B779FBE|nr:salicylic acid-binding protein 2-like [Chenopodium quinoa]